MENNSSDSNRLPGPTFLGLKSRYRFDDFDYTPSPPGGDGEFLNLRLQPDTQSQIEKKETRISVFDRINQELGIVAETNTRKLSVTKAGSERRKSAILVCSSGISISPQDKSNALQDALEKGDQYAQSQKIILDPSIGRNRGLGSHETSTIHASCLDPSTHFPPDSSNALDHTTSVRKTIENISLINHNNGSKPRKTGIVNATQPKTLTLIEQEQNRAKSLPIISNPTLSPLVGETVPAQSLHPIDKVMDRNAAVSKSHIVNYFFTGGSFFGSSKAPSYTTDSAPASMTHSDREMVAQSEVKSMPGSPLHHHYEEKVTLPQFNKLQNQTSKIEEGEKVHQALDEKGKRLGRRPKPSSLREMNFWAPQSM